MVQANVKILEDLQTYLNVCCEESEIRNRFISKTSDFSRNRKLPMERVALMVLNFLKRSLNVEIKEFFEKALCENNVSCSKGAFCLQRLKLNPSFFFLWNQILTGSFYEHYKEEVKRWKGFRLLATDGSMIYLINNPSLRAYFGAQNNQYGDRVMARVMQVEDVLNNIIVFGNLFPISVSEQSVTYQLATSYPPDSLLLFDRNFASYALMYLLINQEQSRHFVIRCKTAGSFTEVASFLHSHKTSKLVTLYASQASINILSELGYKVNKETGITVRMVRIKLPNGETEVLLTNLVDERQYSVEEIKELYGLRWRIETKYFKQKNQMLLEEFSGHSVCSVRQDYLANVFVSNLHNLIEKQCNLLLLLMDDKRKYSYRINQSASLALMKNTIVKLLIRQNETVLILLALQKAFERYLEPERKGRSCPRIRKHKRRHGRFQTFTNYKRNL